MKTFKYTARHIDTDDVIEGVVQANTRDEAIAQIRDGSQVISSLEEVSASTDVTLGSRRVKQKSLAIMCNQFAIVLRSGLPIVRAIELVAEQTDDKSLRRVLDGVAQDVASGLSLGDSFERNGPNLPVTFVQTVRAGEASGGLDIVFERLAAYYRKTAESQCKVRSAMIYPAFVLGVAAVVIVLIMVLAVPTFKSTFESMGAELPIPTRLLIGFSDFMTHNFFVLLIVVIALVVGFRLLLHYNEDFHLAASRLGTRIPVIGKIIVMNASGQYASTMSIMMAAGLPVVEAVDVAAKTISNFYMSRSLEGIEAEVESGRTLSASIEKTGAFPHLVSEMTGVGEETGTLESTLKVISEYYDNEVETLTARALSLLEPALIIILAIIVGVILLAVYLPMFSIYGNFNAGA